MATDPTTKEKGEISFNPDDVLAVFFGGNQSSLMRKEDIKALGDFVYAIALVFKGHQTKIALAVTKETYGKLADCYNDLHKW